MVTEDEELSDYIALLFNGDILYMQRTTLKEAKEEYYNRSKSHQIHKSISPK